LAGEVAIVTFCFAGEGALASPQRVDLPDFTGAALLSVASGLLLWTIAPIEWK